MPFSFGYDTSKFPLVILTAEGKPETDKEMVEFMNSWDPMFSQATQTDKLKILCDFRKLDLFKFPHLMMFKKFLASNKKKIIECIDKTSVLVESDISQKLANVFVKLYNPVRPLKVFSDTKMAMDFFQEISISGNIALPEEISDEDMEKQFKTIIKS